MTHLAVGYRTIEAPGQGRELKTDGYHNHIGGMDIGSLRVRSRAGHPALSGVGVEMLYISPGSTNGGVIQCYNRDTLLYERLSIAANPLIIGSGVGPVELGGSTVTVGGKPVATSPTQALIGSYDTGATFVLPAAGWYETDVRTNITTNGGLCRFEFSAALTSSMAGNNDIYLAFGMDGSTFGAQRCRVLAMQSYIYPVAMFLYATPAAGTHRASVFMYGGAGGGFAGGCNAALYVTEQRA